MNRVLRVLGWSLLAVVVLTATAVVAVSLWAREKKRATDRGWAESFESMEAFVARYPSTPDSAAARELAARSARLGISLDTPAVERTAQERAQAARARLRLVQEQANRLRPLLTFLVAEGSKATDETVDPPPPQVTEFSSRHEAEIEAIETHVLEKDAIAWACDIQKGADAPLPPLLGQRDLANVLLVHALEAARAGNDAAAQRALEASWRLDLVLQERPELFSQFLAMAIAGSHDAVLRRVPATGGEWPERLSTRDWRRSMLRSLQAEAWMFGRAAAQAASSQRDLGQGPSPESAGGVFRPRGRLVGLWLDLSVADHSDHIRRMAVELKGQDPCTLDVEAFTRRVEAGIPWWNVVGRIAMPSLARSWSSVGRALLDDELTGLVIQARSQARSATTAALPSTIPSSVCSGMSWLLRPQANGDLQIEADRSPFKDPKSAPPLRFRVHRRQLAPVRTGGTKAKRP